MNSTSETRPMEHEAPLSCPVCPASQTSPDATKCDHCGTDLRPIRRLRELAAVYFNRALAMLDEGNDRGALEALYVSVAADARQSTARIVLGKLLWRLGRRRDAVQQWTLAANDAGCREAAERLLAAAEQRRRNRGALVVIVMIALVPGVVWLANRQLHPRPDSSPQQAAVLPLPTMTSTPDPSPEDTTQPASSSAIQELAERLDKVAGIRVERQDERLRILLLEGLFPPDSATPEHGLGEALEQTASVIRSAAVPVRVTVVGYTDDAAPHRWKDNWALALARASLVVEQLRREGDPAEWFATSRGDGDPPFANDSLGNRTRNRTVVLFVEAVRS